MHLLNQRVFPFNVPYRYILWKLLQKKTAVFWMFWWLNRRCRFCSSSVNPVQLSITWRRHSDALFRLESLQTHKPLSFVVCSFLNLVWFSFVFYFIIYKRKKHFEKQANIYICTRFSSIDNNKCHHILHLTTREFQTDKKPVKVFVETNLTFYTLHHSKQTSYDW